MININMDEEFFHFVLCRKLERVVDQHDVLFEKKTIAFELFTHKLGF